MLIIKINTTLKHCLCVSIEVPKGVAPTLANDGSVTAVEAQNCKSMEPVIPVLSYHRLLTILYSLLQYTVS